MRPVEFSGQTHHFGPPRGFNESADKVQCGGLPIRASRDADGGVLLQSMWKPSPAELAALAAGACVCVSVWGTAHPPIAIEVEQVEVLP